MRDLVRLPGRHRIHPEIARSGWAIVVVEKARAVFAERVITANRLVHALWDGQCSRFAGDNIVEVDIFIAIDVGAEGDVLAIGRKFVAANFPFCG